MVARLESIPRWAIGAFAVLCIALLARAVWGGANVGYDGLYALRWGADLAGGRLPDFTSAVAPTPHPLANLTSALLSPFGQERENAFAAIVFLSYGALLWMVFRLGAALFSQTVGAVAALLLATRPLLVEGLLDSSVDLPFLALVLAATVQFVEGAKERRVLILLALAGLLRPEAWLLSALYVLWLLATSGKHTCKHNIEIVALALAAPVLWAFADLAVTGDLLFSLHGTRELAEELRRPRSVSIGTQVLPDYLVSLVGEPVAWAGVISGLACLLLVPMRVVLPLTLMFGGIGAFVILGFAGLPVLTRYLLLPAVMMVFLTAAGLYPWREEELWTARWFGAVALAVYCGGMIALAVPAGYSRSKQVSAYAQGRVTVYADLKKLLAPPEVRQAIRSCPPLLAYNHRAVPLLALILDRPPRAIGLRENSGQPGTVLVPASIRTERHFVFSNDSSRLGFSIPPGFHAVAENRSWRLIGSCGR